MPKVTIIIPTFNSELYIRETIESAINQTLEDIEIIVADCVSKDKTLDIIKEYNDNRIKILNRPQEYVGISRNAGIDEANGDYIMFLDSDDILANDACEKAYNQIAKNDDDMTFFGFFEYNDDTKNTKKMDRNIEAFSNFYNKESFCLKDIEKPFISGGEAWYKIYKRTFLNEFNIRFGKEKFIEDTIFYIKCIVNSKTVSVLNEPLYYYRVRSSSNTTTCGEKYWQDVLSTRKICYEATLNSPNKDKFFELLCPYFINSIIYWYIRWGKNKNFPKKEYYEKMHEFFCILNDSHKEKLEANKEYIHHYKKFKHFTKENWDTYKFLGRLKKIFSISNERSHKVLRILGIKIKFKYDKKAFAYKKANKNYKKHVKRLIEKAKNNEKIRVAFYVNDTRWKCQDLFDLMQKSNVYEPFILVGRHSTGKYKFEYQNEEEFNNICQFYINKNMQTYKTFDFNNQKHLSLEEFKPDIIFYSRQFGLAPEHSIEITSGFALTCYVPYFISNSPSLIEAGSKFHNTLWKYYILNNELKDEYKKIMANKGANLSVVGHTILDTYCNDKKEYEKQYVIYVPHCSLGNHLLRYATFDWNGQYILDYAKAHPEIKWVFKPHPILKGKLVESGLMNEEEAEAYYQEWEKIGIKYEGPDYFDLFKQSKCLITDCGSFLAEYMPTKSPVILLRSKKATPYNFLAKKVTQYYYSVWDLNELDLYLDKVLIKKQDPYKERRINMLEKLKLITDASKNIVDDLNKEFKISSN